MQKTLFLAVLVVVVIAVGIFTYQPWQPIDDSQALIESQPNGQKIEPLAPIAPLSEQPPLRLEPRSKYVLDVVLHSVEEVEEMLDKAEQLSTKPRPASEPASIAMVLHGPEIDIFSIRNYSKYHEIVDRAAKLDAYNIIDVKMCMTMMRTRGMRNEDVPGFIELVPYGPDEIERLQSRGYVKL